MCAVCQVSCCLFTNAKFTPREDFYIIKMATYNNKHWLLSHIKNSFISTDDTGMCEIVMLGEDLPKQLYARCQLEKSKQTQTTKSQGGTPEDESDKEYLAEYEPYPELDASDEDDFDSLAESYDIQYDMDFGLHRQRSNTAQRLEKLEQAQRKASKTRIVKWESPTVQLTEEERARLFVRKELPPRTDNGDRPIRKSLLSDQLAKCTFLPHSQYLEFAKFDGTAQAGLPTKTYKIFMTMLPDDHKNYPFRVCVVSSAKVQDLIGYICYKYSIAHPEILLGPVANYGLYISEDDGEVDWDFPSLDPKEPCSKFGLTSLGLVDLKSKNANRHKEVQSSSIPDRGGLHSVVASDDHAANRSRSATFDSTDKSNVNVVSNLKDAARKDKSKGGQKSTYVTFEDKHKTSKVLLDNLPRLGALQSASDAFFKHKTSSGNKSLPHSPQECEALARMETHNLAVEAPQYQSYRVQLCHRVPLTNTNILIGISGERIEIDPLYGNSNKFWSRLKPVSYNIDSVAWCEIIESKSSRATFRLVYSLSYGSNTTGAQRHHGLLQTSASFKHHDFEADADTSREIVEKINRILELRSSCCRKEYKTARERKLQARRSFHLPKSSSDHSSYK